MTYEIYIFFFLHFKFERLMILKYHIYLYFIFKSIMQFQYIFNDISFSNNSLHSYLYFLTFKNHIIYTIYHQFFLLYFFFEWFMKFTSQFSYIAKSHCLWNLRLTYFLIFLFLNHSSNLNPFFLRFHFSLVNIIYLEVFYYI